MKHALISIFLTFSSILVIICFCRKMNNQGYLSVNYVLNECQTAKIGYDIKEDIEDLSTSLQHLSDTFVANDVFSAVVGIGEGIYYFGRFFVMLIIHVLTSTINMMVLALRLCGFERLNYISIKTKKTGDGDLTPYNNGLEWSWVPGQPVHYYN